MEELALTTPIVTPTIINYRVVEIRMNWPNGELDIITADNTGATQHHSYRNGEAVALMLALNTANLTTNSLHKRTIQRLQTDGKLPAGTVNGTP